ncbi:MAG: DUF3710 domain-containing protein [Candidatus Nanopelagicales bacterium]|nr:DUF3710 domain-containing protein [Candidatus Nanopelagicales bacterium]MCF8537505.1 DUF3710 domain-containing protein [Candidatus Nanopelagicales bacterium]MCF8542327.1 DUF3710 domain-containing protein [Candidatus Nanopelagicales bacterium]
MMDRINGGPWDVAEVADDGVERLDLGSVLITPTAGIDVQAQADQDTGAVTQLTLNRPDGMVQVQPYAAPRSGGLWEDIRGQIASSINANGGLVEVVEGPFGPELRAQVSPSDGSAGLQPARFCGMEGPRWFLRAVFLGAAARPGEAADALEAMVRSLVIVRGDEAMPVGAPIPIRLPQQKAVAPADPELPSPFERGPEITETR